MNQSRPLATYCYQSQCNLWEQDIQNKQLDNRVFDVLSDHTNQVFPHSMKSAPPCRPQITPAPITCKTTYLDNLIADSNNLRNTQTESKLFFRDDTPYTLDCVNQKNGDKFEKGRQNSNRQLYQIYHRQEVSQSAYPNTDNKIFDNNTKELNQTIDNRNILYKKI